MATYLDNAGVTQILTKIKSLLAKKAEITAIPTKTSQLTNDSYYQTEYDVNSKISNELGKLDYDFSNATIEEIGGSGAPGAGEGADIYVTSVYETDGVISAKKQSFGRMFTRQVIAQGIPNGEWVKETINSAVGKITSFEYKVVSSLPSTSEGKKGVIYLVAHSGSTTNNVYDEYIFLPAEGSTAARYEKIGTTDIDLTPYAKKTEIPTKVSQLTNDSDFETKANVGSRITGAINSLDKADTAVEGKYVSAVSETNGVITVTRASLPAVGTADSPISNATIESIFTQVFG